MESPARSLLCRNTNFLVRWMLQLDHRWKMTHKMVRQRPHGVEACPESSLLDSAVRSSHLMPLHSSSSWWLEQPYRCYGHPSTSSAGRLGSCAAPLCHAQRGTEPTRRGIAPWHKLRTSWSLSDQVGSGALRWNVQTCIPNCTCTCPWRGICTSGSSASVTGRSCSIPALP